MKKNENFSSSALQEKNIKDNVLFKKILKNILPIIFIAYFISFLDRVNIGYAKLQMLPELGLTEIQYGIAAGIFFLGYAFFEIPSNILLAKTGARKNLTRIMLLWGVTSAATMFVTSATQLYILRLMLGIFESGFFPGIILYLSYWFPSYLRGRVTAILMLATLVAPIIGGPISGIIMDGMHSYMGVSGWRWLFLLEALPIIVVGIVCFFYLCDTPSQAAWLTDEEKEYHRKIMMKDIGESGGNDSHSHNSYLRSALLDPRVYVLAFLYFSTALGVYTFNFWLPTSIQKLGISSVTEISFFTIIPFIFAGLGMMIIGRSSDIRRERKWHFVFSIVLGAVMLSLSTIWNDSLVITLICLSGSSFGFSGAVIVCWAIPSTYLKGKAAPAGIALVSSLGVLSGFAGPALIGVTRELTGSDSIGFYIISLIMILAAVAMLTLMPKQALAVGAVQGKNAQDTDSTDLKMSKS